MGVTTVDFSWADGSFRAGWRRPTAATICWLMRRLPFFGSAMSSLRLVAEAPRDDFYDAPDIDLLRQAVAGGDDAFLRLVERHQDRLLTVCSRLLGDDAEAEDVVQETFFMAFRKGDSFRPQGSVGGWLYRIAVNTSLKRLRRRRVARFVSLVPSAAGYESPTPDPADHRADPARRLEARERWRSTRRRIDALRPSQRVVLILARFEGLSMREIAETLDITEKAAEGRLGRALQQLERRREDPHV